MNTKYYSLIKKSKESKFNLVYFVGTNLQKLQKIAKERNLRIKEISEDNYILYCVSFRPEQIIL